MNRKNNTEYTSHALRIEENGLTRYMGYIRSKDGEVIYTGIPRTTQKAARNSSKILCFPALEAFRYLGWIVSHNSLLLR